MKRIIINERQEKILIKEYLKEAALPEFSTDDLNNIKTFKGRVDYCKQYLGLPIGNGSSRMVFQIDDDKVLKLAKNNKGIVQNEYENDNYYQDIDDVMARVYECADDNTWMISEYVLPASKKDFPVVFGMKFEEFITWLYTSFNNYTYSRKQFPMSLTWNIDAWNESIENNDNLNALHYYLQNYQPDDVRDFTALHNWGLTKRDDGAHLVILDNGVNDEILRKYYRGA